MIGIDIVDLKVAKVNSRWQEQRFLDKIFNDSEQDFILKDKFRFQNIWRLWSMKESAFKSVSNAFGLEKFNPRLFPCNVFTTTSGSVDFFNISIATISEMNPQYVYTTAYLNKDTFKSECIKLPMPFNNTQRDNLRAMALKFLSDMTLVPITSISIKNNKFGVPQFYIEDEAHHSTLTFTHHGNYGGFAILNDF